MLRRNVVLRLRKAINAGRKLLFRRSFAVVLRLRKAINAGRGLLFGRGLATIGAFATCSPQQAWHERGCERIQIVRDDV